MCIRDSYRALYLHLPFCVRRCGYCDFATSAVPADAPEIDAYVEDLCLQIRRKAKEGELGALETVYLGGGTPSVQSFDDEVLAVLGRAHSADDARRAIEAAHTRFENVSVDLMCGIPGQGAESFEASVREAAALGAAHVSVYPLTIEAHTPFDAAVLAGDMEEPDDDVEAAHMEIAARVLAEAGYERYEVASYARPGFECRHNIAYWTGVPYLGLGRSAATMTQNAERRMRVQDGRVTDDMDARGMAAEDLMLGMRMTCGVPDELVEAAAVLLPDAPAVLAELEGEGLVAHADGRWRPTDRGWLCGNELYGRLFDLA